MPAGNAHHRSQARWINERGFQVDKMFRAEIESRKWPGEPPCTTPVTFDVNARAIDTAVRRALHTWWNTHRKPRQRVRDMRIKITEV